MFGKTRIGVILSIPKSSYRLYVKKHVPNISLNDILHDDKSDLSAGGIVIDVPLKYRPLRNQHPIQMSFGEEAQEINLGNLCVDKYVPNILSDMLSESQMHKENHNHEDVEFDSSKRDGGVINTHDHMETLCEHMISR